MALPFCLGNDFKEAENHDLQTKGEWGALVGPIHHSLLKESRLDVAYFQLLD